MIVGYARKNIFSFPVQRQKKYLQKNGCDRLIVSSKKSVEGARELAEELQENDTLLICDFPCLELTLPRMLLFFEKMEKKKVKINSIFDKIYIDDYRESEFIRYLKIIARIDGQIKGSLTLAGLNRARELGNVGGRPRISLEKIDEIREMGEVGRYTYRQIAEFCDVSVGTVYKYLNDEREF